MTRLRQTGRSLAWQARGVRTGQRARRWPVVTAAVVVVVASAVGCSSDAGGDLRGAAAGPDLDGPAYGTWARVADGPLSPRSNAQLAWTGREVLVLGGEGVDPCPPGGDCSVGPPLLQDAAAYDPVADTWRRLADLPVPFAWGGTMAVVDGEVYLSLPEDPDRLLHYDPEADRWDRIAAPGMGARTLVADGHRLLAPLATTLGFGADQVDRAYDPATGSWSDLPIDPLRSGDGRQVVPVDGRLYLFTSGIEDEVHAAVLDGDRWTVLPDPEADGYLPALAAGGLVVTPQDDDYSGDRDDVPGRWALDTTTDEWVDVPVIPDAEGPQVFASWSEGDDVLLVGNVALDADTRTWHRLAAPDELEREGQSDAWAGDRAVVFGGTVVHRGAGSQPPTGELQGDTWTWTPPAG